MTDMLPSSALFLRFSPSASLSVLRCFISSAVKSSCFQTSSCCLILQVDAALSADSFSAEAVAVGLSAEDGNDVHASQTRPL